MFSECPSSEDGMERFACPTPDRMGRYRCIDDHVLCDGFIDCPTGEDEDRQACMFYKTVSAWKFHTSHIQGRTFRLFSLYDRTFRLLFSQFFMTYTTAKGIKIDVNYFRLRKKKEVHLDKNIRPLFQTKAHLDVLADALLRWVRGR